MQRPKGTVFILGGIVASLVLIGVAYFYFDLRGKPVETTSASSPFENVPGDTIEISDVTGEDPTIVDIVKRVSRHIVLPDGRVTVVTILNIEPLRAENPVFYQFAREGDKALLYTDRAILYNPELDRVLDVWHVGEPVQLPMQ